MRVVVPFAADAPKTRLSEVLDADERQAFARTMLEDVLATIEAAGHDPAVLGTAPIEVDAPVTVDDAPLSEAVNGVLARAEAPVAVVMADLPLLTVEALDRLIETEGDLVVAPGRGGGTNAIVVRDPAFRVDYHGVSFRDHLEAARNIGLSVGVVDSHRLATDVDDPVDLLETVLHAEGEAPAWLRAAGFEITTDGDRPSLERSADSDA